MVKKIKRKINWKINSKKNKIGKKNVEFYHDSTSKKSLDFICGFLGSVLLNGILFLLWIPLMLILNFNNYNYLKYIFIFEMIVIILELLIPFMFVKKRKYLALGFWLALIIAALFLLPYYYGLSIQPQTLYGIL